MTTHRSQLSSQRKAALDASDAEYLSQVHERDRLYEAMRIAAERELEESLAPDEELYYPDDVTVDQIIRESIVRSKRKKNAR